MRVTLKASLTALMLTSVAAVPLATATTMLTADAAYAKSDKAKGKGGGKSGKLRLKTSKGKSASRGGTHGGLDDFFGKLTGKDKKAKRTRSAPAKVKVAKSDPMHPSNIGNMNGALNANHNAIAAHIRNGNTNGPVGLMAAYVAARGESAEAMETLGAEGAGDYVLLNQELVDAGYVDEDGNPDLEAYYADVDDGVIEPDDDVEMALKRISWSDQEKLLYDGEFINDEGDPDYGLYEEYRIDNDPIEAIETASTDPYEFDDGFYDDINEASSDAELETDAEQALIDYWNKQGTAPEGSEDALRAMLDERALQIEAEQSVQDALAIEDEGDVEDGELADGEEGCEEGQEGCEPIDDLAAVE